MSVLTGHRRIRQALPLVAGALTVAAFAPAGLWPIAPAMLALLFALWAEAPGPRSAALDGLAFGTGFFLAGVSWVYISMHDYGDMPALLAGLATLAFSLGLALFPALAGALVAALAPRGGARLVLAPFAFILLDAARSLPFNGFPWLAIGYSQTDSWLAGLAPLGGVGLVGLTLCTGAALIAQLIRIVRQARHASLAGGTSARRPRITTLAVISGLALVPWLAGLALQQQRWTEPAGEGLAVALVQGNVPQDLKFDPEQYARSLEHHAGWVERARARLIVLPETAVPRLATDVDPAWWARIRAHAQSLGGDVLVGVPTGDLATRYFNSVISVGTSPVQVYHKRHLVPLGEYIPTGFQWILSILHIPMSSFSAGPDDAPPLSVAGERIAVNICYEDAFGGEIIRSLPEASLLVNVSNIAWFGHSLAPGQHLQMSRMRALETGRDLLRATNTGMTAIVHADGSFQALEPFTEGLLEGRAQGRRGATPYVRLGDWPVTLGSLAVLVAALLFAPWRRSTRLRRTHTDRHTAQREASH
jgi:apolipoprotein N-acyltransferase